MLTRFRTTRGPAFLIIPLAAAVALFLVFAPQIARADVRVIVNGQTVQLDQPPIVRGGRVFVPLRGVFEQLGASVVYDNGVINATGSGHTIQVRIGSTQGIVDGQQRMLDQAPFLVGARTLVPLRFISEALGANVQWDDNSQTVTINSGGNGNYPPPVSQTQTPATITLSNLRPGANSTVQSARPAISAAFSSAVDPNSVRITLDGRDVSSTAYVSSQDILFTPSYNLTATRHTVEVIGKSSSGVGFDRSWAFNSGGSAANNSLNNLVPQDGSTVSSTFNVSGTTIPYARVHIAATASAVYGGILRIGTGTYATDVVADGAGNFSAQVSLAAATSGGNVTVRITSVDPNTNTGTTANLNLRS
jgi:hypothetical protein